jgi:hypothetical protein
MSDIFETANGLNPNNLNDASLDLDGDGFTNLQEFQAGTNPLDPSSSMGIQATEQSGGDVQLRFRTIVGKTYRLERNNSFPAGAWTPVGVGVTGTGQSATVSDGNGASQTKRFYRVVLVP